MYICLYNAKINYLDPIQLCICSFNSSNQFYFNPISRNVQLIFKTNKLVC
jgi:hypothetical protein